MNLSPISAILSKVDDVESYLAAPVSLRERVSSAMQEVDGERISESPIEDGPENPFLWQFIEWMFYGEPEETGMETLEPHI